MKIIHLTSSIFYGGPERQMLGLAATLPESIRTTFVSFGEGGRCVEFLDQVRRDGFTAIRLQNDFPRVLPAVKELTGILRESNCDIVLCHGYKANILGRLAARRARVPVVAVSRGWTGENRKVRTYEWLDRRLISLMDHVVCVSEGQARKVRSWCRMPAQRVSVIQNSARLSTFANRKPDARDRILGFFPASAGVSRVVLAAGRLSPEKGFGVLIEAARSILRADPEAGILLCGEGVLRQDLQQRIAAVGLADRFVMLGFRTDLDTLTTAADVMTLPSFTEGLPNVLLEASSAGIPIVATAVGGTPEVVADGETGFLVPAGDPSALAANISTLLANPGLRTRMGAAGRARMQAFFTFEAQAAAYSKLFARLLPCVHEDGRKPAAPVEAVA